MTARAAHRLGPAALVLAVLLTVTTACGSSSHRAEPRPGRRAAADVTVLAAFGLPRDDGALDRFVDEVSDPSSDHHLDFVGPRALRRRFGASAEAVRDARAALADLGIRGLHLDATGAMLIGPVTGGQARRALGVDLVVQDREDGSEVVQPALDPEVPDALEGRVTEVVGLTATLRPPSGTITGTTEGATPDPGCDDADLAPDADVADYLRYFGTGKLYDAGRTGHGVTIALLASERYDPAPIAAFEHCRESPTVEPDVVSVPLTPALGTGTEVTLDVLMAGWTAPGADLVVVQFDPFGSPVFPLAETLAASAARPRPVDLLSTSITFCEAALPDAELDLAEHLLMALAAQGVSTLSAAGDHGVAGCYPDQTDALPAYPSSSPNATAVGGTQFLLDDGHIVGEEAWREADRSASGGGGTSGHFGHRRYPDIASFAAVNRLNAIPQCDPLRCSWVALGGTSAPAPTLAANLALVLDDARAHGGPRRLGLLNPLIESLADAGRSPITDITRGSTAIGDADCCRAEPGWDQASGWGSITRFDRLAALVARLPRHR